MDIEPGAADSVRAGPLWTAFQAEQLRLWVDRCRRHWSQVHPNTTHTPTPHTRAPPLAKVLSSHHSANPVWVAEWCLGEANANFVLALFHSRTVENCKKTLTTFQKLTHKGPEKDPKGSQKGPKSLPIISGNNGRLFWDIMGHGFGK